jgi:hypothetical protein
LSLTATACGSSLQWLCNADTSRAEPRLRLKRFFSSLYTSLTRGARAVLQLYPVRHPLPYRTTYRASFRFPDRREAWEGDAGERGRRKG